MWVFDSPSKSFTRNKTATPGALIRELQLPVLIQLQRSEGKSCLWVFIVCQGKQRSDRSLYHPLAHTKRRKVGWR
ncbi:hypothetical protein HOLleu_32310 [Holothuria leucospilota]|uniref:Uncharacterized protein n=1 Tax=Holothuria leucospilota TaxID=206669 RepID=A0A9Q1BI53_HOLLE|nr:hypothetical protein HOLleu_32310 [Holothuria leucospilota]